jgi:hypothetical protein
LGPALSQFFFDVLLGIGRDLLPSKEEGLAMTSLTLSCFLLPFCSHDFPLDSVRTLSRGQGEDELGLVGPLFLTSLKTK